MIEPVVVQGERATLDVQVALSATDLPEPEAMLRWAPGRRATDGVWARHWYAGVERSTGFQPYRPKPDALPAHLEHLHEQCRTYYDHLYAHRLRPH